MSVIGERWVGVSDFWGLVLAAAWAYCRLWAWREALGVLLQDGNVFDQTVAVREIVDEPI